MTMTMTDPYRLFLAAGQGSWQATVVRARLHSTAPAAACSCILQETAVVPFHPWILMFRGQAREMTGGLFRGYRGRAILNRLTATTLRVVVEVRL